LTNRYELRLITIRRVFETDEQGLSKTEHIIGVPKPEMEIEATDTLVVFGTLNAVKRFLEINS
jgi:Trk K+ transport system NAD-binding subunit